MVWAQGERSEFASLPLEAVEWPFLERAVDPYVGHVVEPVPRLMVEVGVRSERAAVEEALPEVADRSLDLALSPGTIGPACSDPEAVVVREAHEFRVLGYTAASFLARHG